MTAQDMDSVQEIEPGMTLEEIQIDSMYKINVLLDVEDTLGLIDYEVFPIHDTENIETAQDMINAVKKSIESEIQKLKAESEKI
jgi:acyl carrier protein